MPTVTTLGEGYDSALPAQYQPGDEWTYPRERPLWIHDGVVVVFSDAHYRPGPATVAHCALIEVIRLTKPRAAVANGDIVDGGSIGRHPPFGFSTRPTPVQELHACQERLGDVEQAMPNGSELIFTLGNHDIRWERTLAMKAEEFGELFGMRLEHHFPRWDFAWSVPINWDSAHPVMVKHRNAGGQHAPFNNTLRSGVTMVTGHTHRCQIYAWGDYRGRRWGVECGSLADLGSAAFEYTENGPTTACSGFAVLTFRDGNLLPPELCEVINGKAMFRGEVVAS